MPTLRTPIRVRWWIFLYTFLFAMLAYLQRNSLSIAAERIMPTLHLSQMQVGWLMETFTVVYMVLQLPGGVLGERIGARAVFVAIGVVTFIGTIATPLAPMLLSGTALFVARLLAQALMGAAQSPVFPVGAGISEAWFPVSRWSFVNGLSASGMNLGTAITAPLIVALTAAFGWQGALVWIALPTALLTAGWAWYGRNTPSEHRKVTPAELAELGEIAREPKSAADGHATPQCADQPRGAAARSLLHLHVLRVLPAHDLVVPVSGAGAPPERTRGRLARDAAADRCRRRRLVGRRARGPARDAFRREVGLSHRAARRRSAARRDRHRQRLRRSRRADARLRRRREHRGTVLGGDDVGGARRHDGRERRAQHRRQPRRRDQHPDRRLAFRPRPLVWRVRNRHRLRRGRGRTVAADRCRPAAPNGIASQLIGTRRAILAID